ncbi:CoA-binding protein [Halomarina rubra]|uniref:CoA-binding protein n=1 Tax=Halomarina rubra TaxID=2071873 RepID=A0ABD6ARZ1_9EURY
MPIHSNERLRDLLESTRTIAVVGCSGTPGKDAHGIPKYMQRHGYDVVPVNPFADEVLGEAAYDSLADVPEGVDMVNVFRPSDEVAGIVDSVLDREDVDTVWCQLGITDDEAGERVEASGRNFVQNKCLKVEHAKLVA